MRKSPLVLAANYGRSYPSPPRVHWAVILLSVLAAEAVVYWFVPDPFQNFAFYAVAAAWPVYLCIWVRRLDPRATSLYWAVASLVTGVEFIFSWLLLIVVIFELREELLEHYNRREPVDLRLNFVVTALFSFIYFQYALNRIARQKETAREAFAAENAGSVPA